MMKAIKKYLSILFSVMIFLWNGCSEDSFPGNSENIPDDGEGIELSLKLEVPGLDAVYSRSVSPANEKHVKELDVLVFAEDNGEEYYLYRTHGTDISGDANEKSFKVYLRKSETGVLHRLVVLANLRAEINAADAAIPFESTMTKAEVLQFVTFATASEWPSTDTDFRAFPMWGQSVGMYEINSSATAAGFGTIRMLRSLARIDVGVNMQKVSGEYVAQGSGNMFKISKVSVYNAPTSGYAAPAEAVLNAAAYTKVTEATATGAINTDVLEYTLTTPGYGLIREIYVAEADKPALPADKPLFLVVGGYYNGSSTETFYRIDLFDSGQLGYVTYDVMRNYRYGVNIIEVSEPGYESETVAAASEPCNLTVEITHESEQIGDILYNGQYMLGVSTRKFELGKFSTDNKLYVTANHPDGWSYELSDSPTAISHGQHDWVERLQRTGNELEFDLTSDVDESPAGRSAYIHIKSGALYRVVEINQTSFEELVLDVFPVNELLFESGKAKRVVQPQTITVSWSPTVSDIQVVVVPMVNAMTFQTDPTGSYDGGGPVNITILPEAMSDSDIEDITFQHVSRVDITLVHRGRTLTKSVILRQIHPAVVTEFPNPAGYPLLGGTEYLTVRATSRWTAELLASGAAVDHIVSANTSGGTPGGEEFLFKMQTGSEAKHYGQSMIVFKSPDGAFNDVEVPIDAYWGYPFRYLKDGNYVYRVAYYMEYNTQMNRSNARDHCNDLGGNNSWRLGGGQDHHGFFNSFTYSYLNRQKIGIKEGEFYVTNDGSGLERSFVNLTTGVEEEPSLTPNREAYVRCMRDR